jgi:hypothetical protein
LSANLPVQLPLIIETPKLKSEELVVKAYVDAVFARRSELSQFKRGSGYYHVFEGWTRSQSERSSVSEWVSSGHSIGVSRFGLTLSLDVNLASTSDTSDLAKLVAEAVDLGIRFSTLRDKIGTKFLMSTDSTFSNLPDGLKLIADLNILVAKTDELFKKIEACPKGIEFLAEVKRTRIAVSVATLESLKTEPIKMTDLGDYQSLEVVPELTFEADGCRLVDDISQRLKLLKL